MAEHPASAITGKGQVTIPKQLRQQLGLRRGSSVSFALVGDHIEIGPARQQLNDHPQAFGLLKTTVKPVPVDVDPATLLQP